jgi:hypothetical protein
MGGHLSLVYPLTPHDLERIAHANTERVLTS